jgi:hypothetical protein
MLRHLGASFGVLRRDLGPDDELTVRTRNSTYRIRCVGGGCFEVRGGWFDRQPPIRRRVEIVGCTWGGSAVCADLLAAPGLFLEFGNSVRTTRIQQVVMASRSLDPGVN